MRRAPVLGLIALLAVVGCSGGSSSPAAAPVPPSLAGVGSTAPIDQRITFTIEVPPQSSGTSSRRRAPTALRRGSAAATPVPPPYLSPATAAVVLTLAEVDGTSPKEAPPAIAAIPVKCQNCTFTVPNIPAALGTNEYFVQTYSAYTNGQAAGNLISSGFVNVVVPTKSPAVLGGSPALSIGGYVANVALTPQTVTFTLGAAGTQDIAVSALDAGGATIIGAVQYVSPIVVNVIDAHDFTLDGAASETLSEPLARPIALHYAGTGFSTLVNASTTDENGNNVSASAQAFVALPPTPVGQTPGPSPSPTAFPSPTLPPATTSLYIADGATDTVSEYGFVAQLEAGNAPNPVPTPKRVMQFNPALVVNAIPTLKCSYSSINPAPHSNGNGTSGVAVSSDGTIFTFPTCEDASNNVYIFGFPATSVGPVAPSRIDPIGGTNDGAPTALAYNPVSGKVFGEVQVTANLTTNVLAGFLPTSTGQPPSIVVGSTCYQEFGRQPCNGNFNFFGFGGGANDANGGFGVDANGFAYLPAFWEDTATGDAKSLVNPPAVLTVPVTASSSRTVLQNAIAGLSSLAGATFAPPISAVVDGSILYVLTGSQGVLALQNGTEIYPGLSSCPAPSSMAGVNAPALDLLGNTYNVQCFGAPNGNTDNLQAMYVIAYSIGPTLLGGLGDVDLVPQFVIGGDVVGGFGCGQNAGAFLAASAGYVYVINQYPPSNAFCTQGYSSNAAPTPEIDIYNTNGLLGYHTDIAPVVKLNLSNAWPVGLFIGPSGTVTGGQSILRVPAAPGFRHALYHYQARSAQSRRPRFGRYRPPYRWAIPSPAPTTTP
jgi:hypothetical protein